MNYIAVCIPSIGMSGQMLDDLLGVCRLERRVVHISVYDNSQDGVLADAIHRPGWTIYEEFNEFAATWRSRAHLAYLNDDIVIEPGTLDALAAELDGNEDLGLVSVDRQAETPRVEPRRIRRTEGTVRMGGINSWLFMVKRHCWPLKGIDERFKIWYGDDDLIWKIRNDVGKEVAVVEGVSARHEWSMTLNTVPGVGSLQAADGELWRSMGRP
jgi:hypothetical protein